MKKIILFIALFLGSFLSNAQVATASLQTQGNNTATVIAANTGSINTKLAGTLTITPIAGSIFTITPAVSAITLSSSSVTTSGTVASGQRSVSFTTSSDFVGSINGVTRQAGMIYAFSCDISNTLPAISYVVTAGSIIIDKL